MCHLLQLIVITHVGNCGNSVGPIFDARLSLQNEPTTYNPKHTAVAEITANSVKQVSGSPPKLNAAVDTTANVSENQSTTLGAEPGAVDNTAADVLEKCHADRRAKSDVVVDSAVTSASENQYSFCQANLDTTAAGSWKQRIVR